MVTEAMHDMNNFDTTARRPADMETREFADQLGANQYYTLAEANSSVTPDAVRNAR